MKRKQCSASFKAKVALEAIRGLKIANEIAAEFGFHPTQIGHWKRPVFTTQHTLCSEYTAKSAGLVLNSSGNVANYKLD